jgi:hypothetical protein
MASAYEFPKSDGDTYYAVDVNKSGYGIFPNFEQLSISVTDTSGSQSYSKEMDNHIIQNIGANVCYLNFDAVATTSGWKLNPSEFLLFNGKVTDIHAICDSTKTTTLRIIGQ